MGWIECEGQCVRASSQSTANRDGWLWSVCIADSFSFSCCDQHNTSSAVCRRSLDRPPQATDFGATTDGADWRTSRQISPTCSRSAKRQSRLGVHQVRSAPTERRNPRFSTPKKITILHTSLSNHFGAAAAARGGRVSLRSELSSALDVLRSLSVTSSVPAKLFSR